MEHVGAISEAEWNALNGMSSEEANFMAQLLGNCSIPDDVSSTYWPCHENMALDETHDAMYETNSGYSGHVGYYSNAPQHFFVPNNDYYMMEGYKNNNYSSRIHILTNNALIEGDEFLNQDDHHSIELNENSPVKDDKVINSPSESKKRSRVPDEVQRNKRNMKLKKCTKLEDSDNINNNNNNMVHKQSSSSLCSEDESNASHEMHGVASFSSSKALKSNGKARANRGSATDPQSLYARKRRERINERLRILQSLVPNGTKVDISTMLEEAVQYVKFLQLQIKLLSSDDMWMYAPLAYNGMDIGLDLKMATAKAQS